MDYAHIRHPGADNVQEIDLRSTVQTSLACGQERQSYCCWAINSRWTKAEYVCNLSSRVCKVMMISTLLGLLMNVRLKGFFLISKFHSNLDSPSIHHHMQDVGGQWLELYVMSLRSLRRIIILATMLLAVLLCTLWLDDQPWVFCICMSLWGSGFHSDFFRSWVTNKSHWDVKRTRNMTWHDEIS